MLSAAICVLPTVASPRTSAPIEIAERDNTQKAALAAGLAALEACSAQGYLVAIVVSDATGNVEVTLRADGARAHLLEGAMHKAHMSALLRIPTAQLVKTIARNPSAAGLLAFDQFTAPGGGLPIRADNETIGGIGVAGVPVGGAGGAGGAGDESCAKTRLERLGVK